MGLHNNKNPAVLNNIESYFFNHTEVHIKAMCHGNCNQNKYKFSANNYIRLQKLA